MGHSCWCSWELSHLRIQCMWNTWEQRPQTGKENADCVSCGDLIFLTCRSVPLRHLRGKEDGLPSSSFPHLWLKRFQPKPVNILYPASIIAVRIMGPLSPDNSFYCINDPMFTFSYFPTLLPLLNLFALIPRKQKYIVLASGVKHVLAWQTKWGTHGQILIKWPSTTKGN